MIINNNDYTNHFIVTAYRTDIDGVVLDSNIIFKTNANVDTNDIIGIIKKEKSKYSSPKFVEFDREPFADCVVKLNYEEDGEFYSMCYCMDIVSGDNKITTLRKFDRSTFSSLISKFYPYKLKNALIVNYKEDVEPQIILNRHETTYVFEGDRANIVDDKKKCIKASDRPAVIVDALHDDIKELANITDDAIVQMVKHRDEGPNLEVLWNSKDKDGNGLGHKVSYSFQYIIPLYENDENELTLCELSDHDYDLMYNMFEYIKNTYCRRPLLDKFC